MVTGGRAELWSPAPLANKRTGQGPRAMTRFPVISNKTLSGGNDSRDNSAGHRSGLKPCAATGARGVPVVTSRLYPGVCPATGADRDEAENERVNVIRVLVVHETRLLRSALAALLRDEEGIDAVSACWESAPGRARGFRPQVCIVDGDSAGSVASTEHPGGPGCALLVLARVQFV